jgi:hypothetical protein
MPSSPESFKKLHETRGAAVSLWLKLKGGGQQDMPRTFGIDVMIGIVACITLTVTIPVMKAAEAPERTWQFAERSGGNCQSDCQWDSIRCSSDCSMANDTSQFKCHRNCAITKNKCIEGCGRRESLSRVVDGEQRRETSRHDAVGDGPGTLCKSSQEVLNLALASVYWFFHLLYEQSYDKRAEPKNGYETRDNRERLIDEGRQWFKKKLWLETNVTGRNIRSAHHKTGGADVLNDPHFAEKPLVS